MSGPDELVLRAPLDGWAASLAETGDPVFAEAMLGDGIAIDPTAGVLRAPAAGVVTSVHAARHAVSLKTDAGPEILLHIGIETVALKGEGFQAHVAVGRAVASGEPLISFDLDRAARAAKSLVSPMVITDPAGFELVERHSDGLVGPEDVLLRLRRVRPADGTATSSAAVAGPQASREVVVPLAHGLHARPAARLAARAADFEANIELAVSGRRASARSPVGVMTLGLGQGDRMTILAAGRDAQAAVDALAELVEGGMGESTEPAVKAVTPEPPPAAAAPSPRADGRLGGVPAAPGLAIGAAAWLSHAEIQVAEAGAGTAHERAALAAALGQVAAGIDADAAAEAEPTRRGILAAHASFLADPALAREADRLIGEGKSAGFAWKSAVDAAVAALKALPDARMAERVDDLRDLERRVLVVLAGDETAAPILPDGAILLADDLLPSQLLAVPAGRIAGVATVGGGPTSHVAILAAAMGVPAVVAIGPGLRTVTDGACLILDADGGTLEVAPGAGALAAAQARLAARAARREAALAASRAPARLADGTALSVLANLGALAEAAPAVAAGAEGCGLLRTEFLFLDRQAAPDEDEQAAAYAAIAKALDGGPLTIRLLDIGGDKPAPYLPGPREENPALGVRGVRLLLRRPDLLRSQLRAILKAQAPGMSIMAPMVSTVAELAAVRAALEAAARELGVAQPPPLGVMIETPAAAVMADQLAREADFFSIGTNDLTQYALAMDRGHPALAPEADGLDPAVLRLIRAACQGGGAQGRATSVCGGLAGDPTAIPILVGLGVSRLSMPAAAIAEAKALLRTLSPGACRDLAERALSQVSAAAVRGLAAAARGS